MATRNPEAPSDKRQGQSGGLFFTSLQMVHWRNFHGQVEIPLAPRVFLLGPNASGKSNVLDALRFLRDTADQGLQDAIRSRGGMGAIRCLHARRPPGFTLAVTVGTKIQPDQWKYSLQVRNHPQKHVPEVAAERVTDAQGHPVLDRPQREDKDDPDRLRQTHLEQVVANQKFRPLTEFLTSIRYLHIVPQLMRDLDRSAGRRNDPFGGDFLETIAATPQRTRDARLRKISKALQVAIPQLQDLTLEQDEGGGHWHLQVRFAHWRKSPAKQDERAFSDGTLRLVGLLWSLAEKGGPLLLEEPELGLHTALVSRLPSLMTRLYRRSPRQLLITTHSPHLLNDPGIGLDEVHLLKSGPQGTEMIPATDHQPTASLYSEDGQLSLGEILMPAVAPEQVDRFHMAD
ncbi:MAG: AAA family ATPase [Cyanobacteria bacterium MAG CAR4_bin_6]|nr:AAA family ATPase [Cyanobacteria bacterium MAG CAR4_bin_6]MCY4235604.1 AAA family ATPase [Cyanobacteria bacterium MAG CAR2_bin_4]